MSKDLEERVQDVLAVARERDQPGFSAGHEPAWQRRMKAACAQVFFLGLSTGWDKCVARMDDQFRDLTAGKDGCIRAASGQETAGEPS